MTTMPRAAASLLAAFIGVSQIVPASGPEAVSTRVLVRAIARDAKIIGSGVGGARITIRDVESGEVMAEGVQTGGTGDTDRIMRTDRKRGVAVFEGPRSGFYQVEFNLSRPTWVDVVAEGPLDAPQSMSMASKRVLLMPGRHIEGDGLILELHGYRMLFEGPAQETVEAGATIAVRLNLRMLCGCPIEPGGLWNADRIDLTARLWEGDSLIAEIPMKFSGETSIFLADVPAGSPGEKTLEVVAVDSHAVNFGRVSRLIRVASTD